MNRTTPLSFVFAFILGATLGCADSGSSVPTAPSSPAPSPTRVPFGDFLIPELAACCEGDGSSPACDRATFDALQVVCLGDDRIAANEQPVIRSVVESRQR